MCLWLCAHMLHLGGKGQIRGCYDMAKGALMDGRGLQTLAAMVKAQGGDPAYILEPERFEKAPFCLAPQAEEEGFITHMDTARCGIVSVILGAGRERKEDSIDYSAGILLEKKYGDFVKKGDIIAVLRASRKELLEEASKKLLSAYTIGSEAPPSKKLVYAMVTKDQIVRF